MAGGQVQLIGLTKRFDEHVAVDGINATIQGGEFFSLLGPSGCGKTTTLRMIAGFERPTAGEIVLDGSDVSAVPPHERNVHTVFQNYALFPHLNVFDNIAFGLRRRKVARDEVRRRVHESLELVELGELGSRQPRQLSGGQQQRVALARALVLRPAVLLLDEPLGALDAKIRKQLRIELKALQEEVGITFVFVTHDQEEALSMSDRVAVMNEGRIEQVGDPAAVYEDPASVFVADFLGVSNMMDGEPVGWGSGECTVRIGEATLRARCGDVAARGAGPAGGPAGAPGAARPRVGPRQLPGRDGRAHRLRRRQPPGDRAAADRRGDPGLGRQHRQRRGPQPGDAGVRARARGRVAGAGVPRGHLPGRSPDGPTPRLRWQRARRPSLDSAA